MGRAAQKRPGMTKKTTLWLGKFALKGSYLALEKFTKDCFQRQVLLLYDPRYNKDFLKSFLMYRCVFGAPVYSHTGGHFAN